MGTNQSISCRVCGDERTDGRHVPDTKCPSGLSENGSVVTSQILRYQTASGQFIGVKELNDPENDNW
ncbi:MAG: hypothetical protein V1838_01580 [Patescibacteria group bacterium]